tara:strand:+ start:3207 stop:4709 length:1503 start_codon:yes stop_codon:yes gene_type:complete
MVSKKLFKIDKVNNINIDVLTYGHFDSIHPGHIRFLEYAKTKGKNITVALIGDSIINGRKQFTFSQIERAKSLSHLSMVDQIILLDENELNRLVSISKPNLLVLGNGFENTQESKIREAIEIVKNSGRRVIIHSGDVNYASTDLLNQYEDQLEKERKNLFLSACERCDLDKKAILASMDRWSQARLIVIGDIILDQYAACEAMGMSAEAPVLVVKELKCKNFIGGAGIVAAHINSLGSKCDFISVIGKDENAKILKKELKKEGINFNFITDETRPTTFKKRYIVENQKLFRVSKLEDHSISEEVEDALLTKIDELAKKATGIVISDFVYGVITNGVLNKIKALSKKYDLPLFGDLQCSTQLGSILKFKDFSLLSPNEKEARIAFQDKDISLEILSTDLLKKTNAKNLIMKLGAKGFISYKVSQSGELFSQAFPALIPNPTDVTGAGDSLLAVMAIGLSIGERLMTTSAIGCCQTALAVRFMGNRPIKYEELRDEVLKIMS